jgi:uncharacterized protein
VIFLAKSACLPERQAKESAKRAKFCGLCISPLRTLRELTQVILLFIFLSACNSKKASESQVYSNRLASSSSPYLREHSDNPVDWYEWGAEALEKAKTENKPLIVSVGYASCHWCHVMEKESFMDTAVARLMNENFISIKVDREERPDIDQIYMNAAQLISGNGGWPLNAFTLSDGKPFYAATYFPKEQWIQILTQISELHNNDNDKLTKQAEALTKGIRTFEAIITPQDLKTDYDQKTYQSIFSNWQSVLDYQIGGLSGAPKFPMPVVWEYLLQDHYLTGNKKALEAVTITLDNMAAGGIYDHLAGGFARYSTDENWKVPHFEKMLYDNGQLVSLYSHAYQQTGDPDYAKVVEETLDFVKREMTSPEGGFYSSLNADSEGEEGKFYVWTKSELTGILDNSSRDLFMEYYNMSDSGNWGAGKNIFFRKSKLSESPNQTQKLKDARMKVLRERNKRIHPSLDDKILTSWNALMMEGYIDAYFAMGENEYLQIALKNAAFLQKSMIREDGKLWRNHLNGKSSIDAFLDDYGLLARAYIRLYEATFDIHWLQQARSIADYAVIHFRDKQSGLFYYTSDESEQLVARKMELTDNVIPSSNSILASVLFRLGEYYDQDSYKEMSKIMLNQMSKDILENSPYYPNWASLMGMIAYKPYEIAIMGDKANQINTTLRKRYLPTALFMGGNMEDLPLLENKYVKGKTIIYVCKDRVCKLPVEDASMALLQIK